MARRSFDHIFWELCRNVATMSLDSIEHTGIRTPSVEAITRDIANACGHVGPHGWLTSSFCAIARADPAP
eukprot:1838079-Alexandrium_andersonii.AAC.1